MLHFYTKKECIPDNVTFIFDSDAYFIKCKFNKSEFVDKVLHDIEEATYLDSTSYIDRLGYKLPRNFMSTSSKILIAAYENPDKCINAIEMGTIGFDLVPELNDCYMYVGAGWNYLSEVMFDLNKPCELDGEVITW